MSSRHFLYSLGLLPSKDNNLWQTHILRMYQSSWSFLLTSVSIGSLVHTFPLCIPLSTIISDVAHPLSTINCLRISFQKVTSLGTVTFLEVHIHVTQDGNHINFEERNLYFKEDFYISEHQLQLTCNFSPQNLFTLGKASLYIGCVANNNPIKLQ